MNLGQQRRPRVLRWYLCISVSPTEGHSAETGTNIMVNPEHWDVKAGDLKKRVLINGAVEYIPTKIIKENVRTVVVPLNTIAQEIVDIYADLSGDQLLPFESSERYNDNIKIIFEKAGVTYLVTKFDTVTRTELKVPINEIASSHMARRTFIGNIYRLVRARTSSQPSPATSKAAAPSTATARSTST